jgi:HAD superfamily hydrolase (TIGR01509 family)
MTMESAKSAAQAGPPAPPAGDPARRAGDPAPPAGASEPAAPPKEAHAGGSEARTELAGVLFDMDGLLVDSEPLWFEVECGVAARLDGNWSETDQQALIGGSLPRTVSYLLDRAAKPASREEVARWLVEGMTALLASRELTTMPGARELLAQVRAAGVPYALVTSSERPIMDAVLARLGEHFTATVCADDVRRGKPDPEPYLRAAALLGVDPRSCVALEDSPNGVASAQAAGCQVVAVPSLVPIPAQPGRVIAASLADVDLAMLRRLVAGG